MPKRPVAPIEDRTLRGIALMLAALAGFTGIDTCAKWLVLDGMPTAEVVFVRYLGHLILVIAFALPLGEPFLRTANPRDVGVRGAFLLFSTVLNFAALGYLPLTTTAAIFFSSPLWVCLLSIPLLGEEVGPRRWAAMAVGFLGVLVVTRPWSGPDPLGGPLLRRRGALRRLLLDPDPQARRPRQHHDPAVLRRARRHPRHRAAGAAGLDLARRLGELARLLRHRRLRLGLAPGPHHRPPLRARLDAGADQLRPDDLHDRLELAHLRPAPRRLGARRRRHRRLERPLHLAPRAHARPGGRGPL